MRPPSMSLAAPRSGRRAACLVSLTLTLGAAACSHPTSYPAASGGSGSDTSGTGGILPGGPSSGGSTGSGGSGMTGSGGGSGSGAATATGGSSMTGSGGGAATASGGSGGGSPPGSGGGSGTGGARSFPTQACIDKATALVGMMTDDEKMAQLHQVERANTSAGDITQYMVGSVYSQGGSAPSTNSPTGWADMIDGFRKASFSSRLKIPIIYGLDVVHGAGNVIGATVFPHNIGLGATRNLALVEEVAKTVADEAAGVGADFPFAPVVAVGRDIRWGRTYESFGETTELASQMGVAVINGFQKRTGAFTVLANAKHYLGDGGTKDGVNNSDTSGDETMLRALHLPPYEAAVKAGVGSVMVSYSSWQGTRMHANSAMVNGVLKGDLKFAGFVGSDYNGCYQNNVTLGSCLMGGVDMVMTFGRTASAFVSMVKGLVPGTVPLSRVEDAAKRILITKCEMGLLDGANRLVDRSLTAAVGSNDHRGVARRAVAASLVLLKNDGNTLPLAKDATIALGGKTGDNVGNQCGGWTVTWQGKSGAVTPGTTVKQALESVVTQSKVFYALDGSNNGSGAAKVGIAVIGETPYSEGCGDIPTPNGGDSCVSRPSTLALDAADVQVVQKMKSAGLKVVVVLVAGRPLILDPILSMADAIVMAWLPGTEAAGITDVLFGDVKPSGKLPRTWPKSMDQIPINMGDANYDPLYAFGYGLSY